MPRILSAKQQPRSGVRGEARTRDELAALYRAFAYFGWSDLTYTHLTARAPGERNAYLVHPYGLLFEEVSAASLIKVDFSGRVLGGRADRYNRAGHAIHKSILSAR